MRKPVFAICEQQRRRSACADGIISLVSIVIISCLYLASRAEQAGLSFTWSKTRKTGFLMTGLIWYTYSSDRMYSNIEGECF